MNPSRTTTSASASSARITAMQAERDAASSPEERNAILLRHIEELGKITQSLGRTDPTWKSDMETGLSQARASMSAVQSAQSETEMELIKRQMAEELQAAKFALASQK